MSVAGNAKKRNGGKSMKQEFEVSSMPWPGNQIRVVNEEDMEMISGLLGKPLLKFKPKKKGEIFQGNLHMPVGEIKSDIIAVFDGSADLVYIHFLKKKK